jgi:hypothetical protein
MTAAQSKLEHLKWAIQSRAKNQDCSLRLLALFEKYEDKWKTRKFSRAAQDLIAVSFSLWRATFLADKTSKRAVVFDHGRAFLEKIIEDNSISYPQDKYSREWTFNYYTRNARSSLQQLANFWKGVVSTYQGKKRSPMDRWDYCQALLDEAVANFEKLLTEQKAKVDRAEEARIARNERRRRRKKVRQLTLASRK